MDFPVGHALVLHGGFLINLLRIPLITESRPKHRIILLSDVPPLLAELLHLDPLLGSQALNGVLADLDFSRLLRRLEVLNYRGTYLQQVPERREDLLLSKQNLKINFLIKVDFGLLFWLAVVALRLMEVLYVFSLEIRRRDLVGAL